MSHFITVVYFAPEFIYLVEHSNSVYKNRKNKFKLLTEKHSNTNKIILPVEANCEN